MRKQAGTWGSGIYDNDHVGDFSYGVFKDLKLEEHPEYSMNYWVGQERVIKPKDFGKHLEKWIKSLIDKRQEDWSDSFKVTYKGKENHYYPDSLIYLYLLGRMCGYKFNKEHLTLFKKACLGRIANFENWFKDKSMFVMVEQALLIYRSIDDSSIKDFPSYVKKHGLMREKANKKASAMYITRVYLSKRRN